MSKQIADTVMQFMSQARFQKTRYTHTQADADTHSSLVLSGDSCSGNRNSLGKRRHGATRISEPADRLVSYLHLTLSTYLCAI